MTALIISHSPTTAYDVEIASEDTDELLSDLEAIQVNLTRTLSKIPECHEAGRRALLTWNNAVITELCIRSVCILPQPESWRVKAQREPLPAA